MLLASEVAVVYLEAGAMVLTILVHSCMLRMDCMLRFDYKSVSRSSDCCALYSLFHCRRKMLQRILFLIDSAQMDLNMRNMLTSLSMHSRLVSMDCSLMAICDHRLSLLG